MSMKLHAQVELRGFCMPAASEGEMAQPDLGLQSVLTSSQSTSLGSMTLPTSSTTCESTSVPIAVFCILSGCKASKASLSHSRITSSASCSLFLSASRNSGHWNHTYCMNVHAKGPRHSKDMVCTMQPCAVQHRKAIMSQKAAKLTLPWQLD